MFSGVNPEMFAVKPANVLERVLKVAEMRIMGSFL